jgi:flagellar basal-body rod modification protein FlgD
MDIISTGNEALERINAPSSQPSSNAFSALDQGDFLRLLTVQLEQQDPLEPVDNKDMLAQLAQFSALAGTSTSNATLDDISAKLDALISLQSGE